ncbi:MAG: O-antigen ligase family protein [Blastocatellia bacterium]
MDIQPHKPAMFFAESPRLRIIASVFFVSAGVTIAAIQSGSGHHREGLVVGLIGCALAYLAAGPISLDALVIGWFATTPLASFYIRFPTDRSIVTYDRAVFALVITAVLLTSIRNVTNTGIVRGDATRSGSELFGEQAPARLTSLSLTRFEIAWVLLSVLALSSAVSRSNNFIYALRIAIDTFWLPLLAFHFARNHLDLRGRGGVFLLCGILLALFLFATGAVEFITGADLFAYKGSEIVREGERRVNGPFAADSSFAIICLLIFLFLLAAPRVFRVRFDRMGGLAYTCALVASASGAMLPLFRAVALALIVCWFIWQALNPQHRWMHLSRSALRRSAAIGLTLIALAGVIVTIAPSLVADRLTDPRSAYGRVATWQAATEIMFDNPLFGVGLTNYSDYYDATHYYSDQPPEELLETKASDRPHSNLLWIGAELGLIGFALYIAANVYLFMIGWSALKRTSESWRPNAASCFVSLVAAYWITGLTLASGYYSDLNLYFFFLLGVLSNSSPTPSVRS